MIRKRLQEKFKKKMVEEKLSGVIENTLQNIKQAVDDGIFDNFRYNYFKKKHFIKFCKLCAISANPHPITQQTIDVYGELIKKYASYDECPHQALFKSDGIENAVRFLFEKSNYNN